jgi:hypothetical protein
MTNVHATTLSITTFRIMTLSINENHHNCTHHKHLVPLYWGHHAEAIMLRSTCWSCRVSHFYILMPSVIVLSVFMLSADMLNVVMLLLSYDYQSNYLAKKSWKNNSTSIKLALAYAGQLATQKDYLLKLKLDY